MPQFTTLWTKIETHSYHCLFASLFPLYGPIGYNKWQITESAWRWVAVMKAQTAPKKKDGWRQPTANVTMLHGAGRKGDKTPESSTADVVADVVWQLCWGVHLNLQRKFFTCETTERHWVKLCFLSIASVSPCLYINLPVWSIGKLSEMRLRIDLPQMNSTTCAIRLKVILWFYENFETCQLTLQIFVVKGVSYY